MTNKSINYDIERIQEAINVLKEVNETMDELKAIQELMDWIG